MLIQMLADRFTAGGVLAAKGSQITVDDDLAFRWIGDGVATDVGQEREALQGTLDPVSGAGSAAILSIASPDGTDVGDVLSAQLSTGWTVTGYQWTRDGVDIGGATSSTYTLVSADAGKAIGVRGSGATYTSSITAAAPAFPAGQLYLDALPLFIDSANLAYA